MITKTLRGATQPTHDSNRRAMKILAVFSALVLVWLVLSHTVFKVGGSPSSSAPVPPVPAVTKTAPAAAKTSTQTGPAPDFSRNPFKAP